MPFKLYNCIINIGDDMKKYERKNVSFDLSKDEEKELYEWLQKLPHGQFSAETKEYWMKKMKEERK